MTRAALAPAPQGAALLILLAGGACAGRAAAPTGPGPVVTAYASALRAGHDADVAALTSGRARGGTGARAASNLPAVDRADAAAALEEAARRGFGVVRAEGHGLRGVQLVAAADGEWRLATLPFGRRSATVDEAVGAYLEAVGEHDAEALLLLLGDRRDSAAREITERTDGLRSRRGAMEVSGNHARVRIADSWWLLLEAGPGGWKVVGSEP